MGRVPASASQLADAVRAIADRTGVGLDQLTAYVDVDGACGHGVALWGACPACGRPGVPDAVAQEVDAHIDRVSGRKLPGRLTVADVAALRGVSEATVRSYRLRYPEEHPNAFPVALEDVPGPTVWDARLRPALEAWRSVGRGAGGGRRRAAPAPAAVPEVVEAAPVVKPRRTLITEPCLEWLSGTQLWIDLEHGDPATDVDGVMMRRMIDAPRNKRGAVKIDVTSWEEADTLVKWAEYHADASADNAAEDIRYRGEHNAALAFIRRATELREKFEQD